VKNIRLLSSKILVQNDTMAGICILLTEKLPLKKPQHHGNIEPFCIGAENSKCPL